MKTLILALLLAGCGMQESADKQNREWEAFLAWEDSTLVLNAKFTLPPEPFRWRAKVCESTEQWTKYEIYTDHSRFDQYVTVKGGRVVAMWGYK